MFKINLCKFLFDFSLEFFMEAEPPLSSPPSNRALKQKFKDLPHPMDFFKLTNFEEWGCPVTLGMLSWHENGSINIHTDAYLNKS